MFCRVRVTHQPRAVQLMKPRCARNCTSAHTACRPVPGSEVRLIEQRVLPAPMAACVLAFWAALAEPGAGPDVAPGFPAWPQQPFSQQNAMVYNTERMSNTARQVTVLIEDDMDAGGDDLVVPQSPNPGVPDAPGGEPVRPSTPSEPPSNPPSKSSPFPAEPVPPVSGEPPHFLLNWPVL